MSTLRELIVDGWPDSLKMPTQLEQCWSYRDELSVENGMVLKGERIVIPLSIQQDILQQIHAGHQSERCKLRARSCVFWTITNKDIDKVVHWCDSRTVRFEDKNRKTQPTMHNYKLSVSDADNDVPLRLIRSPGVMDHDGQYKMKTGWVVRKPRSVIRVMWMHNYIKQLL